MKKARERIPNDGGDMAQDQHGKLFLEHDDSDVFSGLSESMVNEGWATIGGLGAGAAAC